MLSSGVWARRPLPEDSQLASTPQLLRNKAEQRVGQLLAGKWRIDRLLDVGGMASVFAATHRNGNRVAIKVLHDVYATNQDVRDRFLREGYVANKVGHPGAVQVLDDDVLPDGGVFLVMELLEGISLEARLEGAKTLSQAEALHIADRVLDVLAAAHDKGIVHRDVKPANVFLTHAGEVKVLDFGLARVKEQTLRGSLTRTGMVIGTASYMPPEQARGKKDLIDHRTDVWAVGATLFRALTGRYVHLGGSVNERLIAAMSERAPSLADVAPHLARPLTVLVDRALAFQKVDRWPDARSMQREVRRVYELIEHQPIPSLRRLMAEVGWATTERRPPTFDSASDVHISVVFEPSAAGDSVMVEMEAEDGRSERFELRRRPQAAEPADEELSEVSVVEVPVQPARKA